MKRNLHSPRPRRARAGAGEIPASRRAPLGRAALRWRREQLVAELERGIADHQELNATLAEILAIDRRLA